MHTNHKTESIVNPPSLEKTIYSLFLANDKGSSIGECSYCIVWTVF